MTKLLRFMAAHPWPVLALALLLSVLAADQLPRLRIDVSPQALAMEGDPARAFYRRTLALFGSDTISILFFQDSDLFAHDRLVAIRDLIARVQSLPFVVRTESLFSVPNLRTVDSYVHTEPYLATLPETPAQIQAICTAARANPFVHNNLLADDGHAMAVNVSIDSDQRRPGFDEEVQRRLAQELAPLQGRFAQVFQLGLPSIRSAIGELMRHDQRIIAPAAVVVLLLTLLLTLRRLVGVLIPLVTAGLSVLWTLGAMAAFAIPVNVMTAMVPVLLIIVGSSENIHLLSEYYQERGRGAPKTVALERMAARMGLAVLLTFATTYLGFLSIAATPIQILREFGLVASSALLGNFLATITLVPALLRLLSGSQPLPLRRIGQRLYRRLVQGIGQLAVRHRRSLLLLSLTLVIGALFGMGGLRVDNNLLNYLAPSDPIRQRAEMLHRALAGVDTFTLVVDGRIQGTFRQVHYLRELQKVQHYLAGLGQFDTNVSFADYVALLNSAANDSGRLELPGSDAELEELLLFVKPRHIEGLVSPDFSQATLLVRYSQQSSGRMKRALRGLEHFVASAVDPGLRVRATGESVLSSQAADYITRGQVGSLGLMLVAILVIIALLFMNVRAGLLAMAVNAFPVLILFGVMGYADIPLDTGTALIAAIAVGICVNHTVHFMVRYNRELRRHQDESRAITSTLQAETLPILVTSVTMSAGFATLGLSSFPPVVSFGMLSSLVMLTALFANLLVTPLLLAATPLVSLWELISLRLRRELARQCALFTSMTPRQMRRITARGRLCSYRPGEALIRQGERDQELYVVLHGQVEMFTPSAEGRPQEIRLLGRGAVLGVLAVVSDLPRFVTVVAITEVELLALDWSRIEQLGRLSPATTALLYRNLMRIVSVRLAGRIPGLSMSPRAAAEVPGFAASGPSAEQENVA